MNTQEIMPGTLVHGRYIVRVRIGEGGGGIVYRAYDTNLESWVILKQIKESAVRPDDRRTEVNVLKELRHQRIPKVLDYFVYEGRVYTVMDFISGRDFGMMLREYHRFDERRVLKWAGQLADVLAYIHSRKPPIVHSDVKPSNIMVDQNDEVTLIDFNIARIFQKERKDISWISAGYSPPEQFGDIAVYEHFRKDRLERGTPVFYREKPPAAFFSKQIDPRTDVYSFGATLYHLLTGIRPDPLYECICPLSKTGTPVSAGFAAVIERCMQTDRDLRYRNGGELVNALNALSRGAGAVPSENERTVIPPVDTSYKHTGSAYQDRAVSGRMSGNPAGPAAVPEREIRRGYTGGARPDPAEATGRFPGISGGYADRPFEGTEFDRSYRDPAGERGGRTAGSPEIIPGPGRTNPYVNDGPPDSMRLRTGTEELQKSRKTAKILAGLVAVAACAALFLGIGIWRTGGTQVASDSTRTVVDTSNEGNDTQGPSEPVATATPEPAATPKPTATAKPTPTPKPTAKPVPSSLKCTVSESAPSNMKKLQWYPFDTSDATSYLIQNTEIYYDNQPHSAMDGDIITSWQEGAAGLGIGETLWLGYDHPTEISCLVMHLGNWRTAEIYGNNARPKSFRLRIGSWSQDITFKNGMTVKYVTFSEPCEVDELEFVITAVYEGIDEDCCISEIEAYGS